MPKARSAAPRRPRPPAADAVEAILAQWKRERPDVDTGMLGIAGRITVLQALQEQEFNAIAAAHDVDRGLTDVLAALRRAGPPYRLTPTDLFNSMMVTSGGMTHRLDRLEKLGLVERRPHPDDRRGTHVGLTAKGRALIDQLMPQSMKLIARRYGVLGKSDARKLAELLRRVLKAEPKPQP